jgi:Flp pilus assembly protein TadD
MRRQLRPWCAAIALALAVAGAAGAKEGAEEDAAAQDPSHVAARSAIAERRYADAVRLLGEALGRDAGNAETHNLLGYAHRKNGDLPRAFQHYHEALRLDPDHRGAHELHRRGLPAGRQRRQGRGPPSSARAPLPVALRGTR